MEPNLESTHATWGLQGKQEPEGETSLSLPPLPSETSAAFPLSSGYILTPAWHSFVPVCLLASCLPVCPSCPQVLECPMCHPAPLHMPFPLARMPFHLFTWLSHCHLSNLSPGNVSSQQPFLLPAQGSAPCGLPQFPCISEVHGVLASVHSHLPHRPRMPPFLMSS